MTEFQNKSFSVYPGAMGGEQYRDNWERVFGKKGTKEEEEADAMRRWEAQKSPDCPNREPPGPCVYNSRPGLCTYCNKGTTSDP